MVIIYIIIFIERVYEIVPSLPHLFIMFKHLKDNQLRVQKTVQGFGGRHLCQRSIDAVIIFPFREEWESI